MTAAHDALASTEARAENYHTGCMSLFRPDLRRPCGYESDQQREYHGQVPALRNGPADQPDYFPSQCGHAGSEPERWSSGESVQDLHSQEVLGFHGEESAARALGHDFAGDDAHLSGDQYSCVRVRFK